MPAGYSFRPRAWAFAAAAAACAAGIALGHWQAGRTEEKRALGKKALGATEMPAVGTALVDGELAWRMHSGGHTTAPNIDTFVDWSARYIKGPAGKEPAKEPDK